MAGWTLCCSVAVNACAKDGSVDHSLQSTGAVVQELECPLFEGSPQRFQWPATEATGLPSMQGLREYARKTLSQYANGATLERMRAHQRAAQEQLQNQPGDAQPSPHMVYMQNVTAIVLLTVESLQHKGLAPPRKPLIRRLRRQLGMADAPPPLDTRCASDLRHLALHHLASAVVCAWPAAVTSQCACVSSEAHTAMQCVLCLVQPCQSRPAQSIDHRCASLEGYHVMQS